MGETIRKGLKEVKMTEFQIQMIGRIHSPFKKRFGTPRQGILTPSTRAFIHIFPTYRDGLDGLEEFSHLWLMSYLHQSEPVSKLKVRPPRLRGQKRGVFSTRGPHRPNPVGLSAVKLERVESEGLWVSGVDLLDQTPIFDIKPYISRYDQMNGSFEPDWIDAKVPIQLEFSEGFEVSLEKLPPSPHVSKEEIREMIKECLFFDPRPIPYLKRESETYYLSLHEFDVEILNQGEQFKVIRIFVRSETTPARKG